MESSESVPVAGGGSFDFASSGGITRIVSRHGNGTFRSLEKSGICRSHKVRMKIEELQRIQIEPESFEFIRDQIRENVGCAGRRSLEPILIRWQCGIDA